MAFSVDAARQMYRERGPVGFVRTMQTALGLRDKNGVRHRDKDGRPVLESQVITPDSVSLRGLATAVFGDCGAESLDSQLQQQAPTIGALHGDVLEAGNDIVPGNFHNITAYNETVAGLLEAKILEAYNSPEFISSMLTQNIPSNKVQEKFIGISTPADTAQERKPGQSHSRAALTERYVTTPITQNRANAIDVTREAVMFDQTRQVLQHAELVSKTLALRKEYLVLDTVLGVTNTYTYGGTTYYTYVASGGNWVNVINNDLTDWTSLDQVWLMFSQMTDQETGQPIAIDARDLLVMPANLHLMEKILTDTGVEQAEGTNRTIIGIGKNPAAGRWNSPMYSPYAYKRMVDTASDDNNMSAGLCSRISDQNSYSWGASDRATYGGSIWYAGAFKKAFCYVENLPLTIVRAAPTSYEMADRGLVFSMFCDEMGIPGILDPRYVIRSQNFAATTANW